MSGTLLAALLKCLNSLRGHRSPGLFVLMTVAVTLTSCLPKEDSLTEDSLQGAPGQSYGGFVGLDSVETEAATKIRLRWTPTDDPRVVSYNIYDVTLASQPRLIRTVNSHTSEATIAGLSHGFYYAFRVRAADSKNREDSNTKDLVGIPYGGIQGVQVLSSSSARLTYADASAGEARETNVYCKTAAGNPYQLVANVRDITITEVVLEDLVPNTTYTCRAAIVVDGNEDNNTETVVFQALGKADSLAFDPQPGNGAAGEVLSQQPTVRVLDENGNIVAGGPDSTAMITLEVAQESPSVGTVRGTYAMNAVAGVAKFVDIYLQESGVKILKATKEDTSTAEFGTEALSINSNSFVISAGSVSPDNSTITINPASPPAEPKVADGIASYQVKFKLMDSFGNAVSGVRPQFNSNIIGDILTQPLTNTDAFGETYGSISTSIADTNPARVLSITSPAGLSTVQVLAPFKHGPAKKLAYTVQPVNSPAGDLSLSEVRVAVQDNLGNIVTTGAGATAVVSLSIANNSQGAVLSGTTTKAATGGLVTFDDLGIDLTGMQYQLVASSVPLDPAYSNKFNVTAGTPQLVSLTGPTEVNSGACSTAIVIQLQDGGGNPANASQTTSIQLSGFGTSTLHSSSSCGGSFNPLVTFTAGTHTKTFYLKNNKALALNILATDLSNILTAGSLSLNVNASKMKLTAQSTGAPAGTMRVPAGVCSPAISITPLAFDGSAGPIFSSRSVTMVGLSGNSKIYSDSSCSTELDPQAIDLAMNPLPDPATYLYFKSPVGENLSLTISDSSSNLTTTSLPQNVIVTASDIDLSGPSSVVAGQCSSAFTVALKDTQGNNIAVDQDTPLSISGIAGVSATGKFYTSPACAGGGFTDSIVMPDGASLLQLYFKGIASEVLNIQVSDDSGNMQASNIHQLVVSPSAFQLVAPGPPYSGYSESSNCAGPFKVKTLDGLGDPADAVTTITASLSGAGDAGGYYSDFDCTQEITQVQFAPGEGAKNVYLRGDYPESSLTLTVTDQAAVLSPATLNWQVTGRVSWLGTASSLYNDLGELMPFTIGLKPVAARYDGVYSAMGLSFDPTHKYLYVADYSQHKIVKYDYQDHEYIGWVGALYHEAGIGSSGSNLSVPSTAQCINTAHTQPLPGWCTGGNSYGSTSRLGVGGMYYPYDLVDDGTFLYVTSYHGHSVARYYSSTGAFAGWIGFVKSNPPTSAGPGGPGSCSTTLPDTQTPGWCMGGQPEYHNESSPFTGDGRMRYPMGIAYDSNFLYVGAYGAVLRFQKTTGAFQGWVGMVMETPTGGATGCTLAAPGTATPGWCMGGKYAEVNPRDYNGVAGGVQQAGSLLIDGNYLYVVHRGYSGAISKYNVTTGAFEGMLDDLNYSWSGPRQITTDGSYFYIADNYRIIKTSKTGLVEGWMGKVGNNANLTGPGCSGLLNNQNTPGWCLGGTYKPGFDENSFYAARSIAYDGNGNILTGSELYPGISKFNANTGALIGTLGLRSLSPQTWSNNENLTAEFHGFDDHSFYEPRDAAVTGDYLFVAESGSSRVKKINRKTGELLGWIGGMTSWATSGESGNCLGGNGMGPSPGWCLGANFLPRFAFGNSSMIASTVDGIMRYPYGLATDGTWLYITDHEAHRVQRFKVSDGSYGGWIGRINISPTGGDPGCNGAAVDTFTPGWCTGGYSESGSADGDLSYPSGIHYAAGNLYVVDSANQRVNSYSATTGAFNGWMGRIGSAPSTGCTTGSNGVYTVSTSGWCKGGTSSRAATNDRGGGFYFRDDRHGGITSDGTYLYITNGRLRRVDRFKFDGTYHGAAIVNELNYTTGWTTVGTDIAAMQNSCSNPNSIWTDGVNIYGTSVVPCSRNGSTFIAWKMTLSSGQMVGWAGGIYASNPPTGGDPGCVGAAEYTPGWCQGGRMGIGLKLGQFAGDWGRITGDDHFVYVTDQSANRVTRFPK